MSASIGGAVWLLGKSPRFILAFLIPFLCMPIAIAAEIRENLHDERVAVLEGVIVPGDFEKVKEFILSSIHTRIFLGSPGGDLNEAMKIGRLLREFKFQTIAPVRSSFLNEASRRTLIERSGVKNKSNYLCASACFFVFVAGIQRETQFGDGVALGIHRPYMSASDLRAISAQSAISAAAATRAIVDG